MYFYYNNKNYKERGTIRSTVEIPDWLCGVTSRHFLLNGNLLPFEVETPVKS